MTRTSDIIRSARVLLADTDSASYRWSDEDLLSHLSEGQQELAKATLHLRGSTNIPLLFGQHQYRLPADLLRIKASWYKGTRLPIASISDLNRLQYYYEEFSPIRVFGGSFNSSTQLLNTMWRNETTEGDIRAIILENENLDSFRVYPRPFNKDLPKKPEVDMGSGIVSRVSTEDTSDDSGIITRVNDPGVQDSARDPVGALVDISQSNEFITLDYSRIPQAINSTSDELEIKMAYDIAMKYYIAYQAYLSNTDRQSIDKAHIHLQNYERQVKMASREASLSNRDSNQSQTTYRPLG